MNCPVCPDQVLAMSERQGVEIDYCPSCRGIWLDRGELDKLLAKEGLAAAPLTVPREGGGAERDRYERDRYDRDRSEKKSRKKSFLGEFLDF